MRKRRVWWEHLIAHTHNWLYRQGIRWGDPHVAGIQNTPRPIRDVLGVTSLLLRKRNYW